MVENILGTRNSMLKSMASEIPLLSQKKRSMFTMNFTNMDTQTKKKRKESQHHASEGEKRLGVQGWKVTKIKRDTGN